MRRYLRPEDLEPTEAEKRAARAIGDAQQAPGIGSAIGTAAGGALGALGLLIPGGVGAPLIGLGASAGGALGGAIGAGLGGAQASAAEDTIAAGNARRAKLMTAEELRRRALEAYLRREAP